MQMIDMATHALICHNKLSGRLNVFPEAKSEGEKSRAMLIFILKNLILFSCLELKKEVDTINKLINPNYSGMI